MCSRFVSSLQAIYSLSDGLFQVQADDFVGTWIVSLVAARVTVEQSYTAVLFGSDSDHPLLQHVRATCDIAVFVQSKAAFSDHRLTFLKCELLFFL